MTLTASISRFARSYLLSPEAFLLCILMLLLYNSLFHMKPIWSYFQRAKVKLQLRVNGQYDQHLTTANEEHVTKEKTKASWGLIKGNAATFAIQGRRPHMEDRYNIVDELDHTNTSIYGIFDGHGGEVSYSILS